MCQFLEACLVLGEHWPQRDSAWPRAPPLGTPTRLLSSSVIVCGNRESTFFVIQSFNPSITSWRTPLITMRHKKDGFAAKGKRHTNAPRHRPNNHDQDEEGQAGNRRPPFKAACWDLEHCDPKRCSGKRLMHFGLMRELSVGQKFQGVVIS